jgi:hypothetical protein
MFNLTGIQHYLCLASFLLKSIINPQSLALGKSLSVSWNF